VTAPNSHPQDRQHEKIVHWWLGCGRPDGFEQRDLFASDARLRYCVGEHSPEDAWPAFQPGPLDAAHGYSRHTVEVEFALSTDALAAQGCPTLELHILASHGPCPDLALSLNGHDGLVLFRPRRLDRSGSPFPPSAIAAPIRRALAVPATALKPGRNVLTLTTIGPGGTAEEERTPAQLPYLGSWFGSGITWLDLGLTRRAEQPDPPVTVRSTHLFVDTAEGPRELVDVTTSATDIPARLRFEFAPVGYPPVTSSIDVPHRFGDVNARLEVPCLDAPTEGTAIVRGGTFYRRTDVRFRPSRKWTLHIFPHVHLDLGYTDAQAKVVELHSRNVDRAIGLCEADPDYRFTIDGSIVLEHHARTRAPRETRRVQELLSEGRIAVNRLRLLFLSGVASRDEIIDSFDDVFSRGSASRRCAHLTDVPSYSSALPALLVGAGVDNFFGIANHTRGGNADSDVLHRQSPFVWRGNDGSQVLAFFADCYSQLRFMCADPPTLAGLENGLCRFVDVYERPDYAPSHLPIVGTHADNEDLAHGYSDVVKRWNERYLWPRAIFSTPAQYFSEVEPQRASLPSFCGDGGSYWEDGVGASAAAVIVHRRAQSLLPVARTLQALAPHLTDNKPDTATIQAAAANLLIGSEHTWTAAHATEHPESEHANRQLGWKRLRVEAALDGAAGLVDVSLSQLAEEIALASPALLLFNPTPWPRHLETSFESDDLILADGALPASVEPQPHAPARTHVRTAQPVPGFSYVSFPLANGRPVPAEWRALFERVLETEQYRVTLDPDLGGIAQVTDKRLGRDLLTENTQLRMLQINYVQGGGGDADRGTGPSASSLYDAQPWRDAPELAVTPSPWSSVSVLEQPWGLLLRCRGRMPDGSSFEVRLRVPQDGLCEAQLRLEKQPVLAKEGVYISFPFHVPNASVVYDRQIGWVDYSEDHLPGACYEWLTTQHAVVLSNTDVAVSWHSADAPLFTLDFVRGTWQRGPSTSDGVLHSWVMNNYWWTNVPAKQSGPATFRYAFGAMPGADRARAARLGRQFRRPPLAHIMTQLDKGRPRTGRLPVASALDPTPWPDNITADWRPSRTREGSVTLFLQELAGIETLVEVTVPARVREVQLVDSQEEAVHALLDASDGVVEVDVPAFGMAFVVMHP
jgi:hypothetical protein